MALTQISTAGVKDDAVTAGKIPANAVGNSEIAADAITRDKIADDVIASEHFIAGEVDANALASNSVTTAKLDGSAVTTAKIAANAVTDAKIANDAVTNAKVADDAVNTAQLADSAVHTQSINDSAVTTAKINNSAVTTAKIADSAVTDAKIASGISASKITGLATDSITEGDSKVEVIDSGSNGNIQFVTDNTTRAQFKTGSSCDNQLLIGVAGSSNQDIDVGVCIGSSSFSRPGVILRGNTTNKGDISFCDNSNSDSSDGVSEGLLRYDHATDHMEFHTADSERVRIDSNGDVGIGTNNPTDKLHVVGTAHVTSNSYFGGNIYAYSDIRIGGTGSANGFDDYEQGNWSPVMKDASGNTYSGGGTITGHYVKIGEMVIVQFAGTSLGNSGMASNQILIHGLPFTPRSTAVAFAQLRYGNNISTAQFGPHVQCDANNSIGSMNKIHDNAGDIKTINWNHMQHSSGYYAIRWTLSYRSN